MFEPDLPSVTFSILSRIDLTATPWTEQRYACPNFFQYPLPDRPHCNCRCCLRHEPVDQLSVSSPGSTSLQQLVDLLDRVVVGAFSILSRIDLTATTGTAASCARRSSFQYPLPDRPHCNVIAPTVASRSIQRFQYPLPDRPHCNRLPARLDGLVSPLSVSSPGSTSLQLWRRGTNFETMLTFSILSRIDLTATSLPALLCLDLPSFQYPLPDRPHCNSLRRWKSGRTGRLSVSSPGSTSLQRRERNTQRRTGVSFSILSRIDLTATPTRRGRPS